jgi:hypothetical protein
MRNSMTNIRRQIYLILGLSLIIWLVGCSSSRKEDPALQMRVQRIQATLTDIVEALEKYNDDRGYFPKGMATLRDAGYLSIMPDLEREWSFKYYTDGGRIMMVEAVSRAAMPDGEGHNMTYRVPDQIYEGYGITEFPE